MAITKIHAIKSTLGKALAYIENPDKTDGQMLVSGYNCEPQTASIDFEMTAVLAHKARNLKRKRSTNLAYHLIQSFSPEDAVQFLSPETFTTQLKHSSIVKDAVQRTQQGSVFLKILAPESRVLVAGEDHIETAFFVVSPVNQVKEQPGKLKCC